MAFCCSFRLLAILRETSGRVDDVRCCGPLEVMFQEFQEQERFTVLLDMLEVELGAYEDSKYQQEGMMRPPSPLLLKAAISDVIDSKDQSKPL